MAVAKLSKLFIASHKSDAEAFLKKFQRTSAVEIKPYSEKLETSTLPIDTSRENKTNVGKALDILNEYKDKELKKIAAKAGKLVIKRSEYENILEIDNLEEIAGEIIDLDSETSNLEHRISETDPKIHQLKIWSGYRNDISDLGIKQKYTIRLGAIKSERTDFNIILQELEENHISCQSISEEGDIIYVILAYHNSFSTEAQKYISGLAFDEAEISEYEGTIEKNIEILNKNIEYYRSRRQKIIEQIVVLTEKYERSLTIYLDYLDNNLEIEEALNLGFSTDSVSFYTAWIKETDQDRIFYFIDYIVYHFH